MTDPLRADLDTLGHALQRRRMFDRLFEATADPVQLGHYDILHELGRGAMGVVYAARDTKLGRQVAIKRLQDRGDANLRERLVHEAQAMAKLNHPNVVPIYEIG
ncbi:MAG: protein kinase, partial [Myxococcales bacterium]|nr:protein kinase [Myxococcales bacterium]